MQDIADHSKQSINTVRDHKEQGWLLPGNLYSVSKYISSMRQLKEEKEKAEKRKNAMKNGECDEWGEPL